MLLLQRRCRPRRRYCPSPFPPPFCLLPLLTTHPHYSHHVAGLVLGFGDPTTTTTSTTIAAAWHTNVRGVQTPLPPEWCTAPLNSTTVQVPSEGRSAVTACEFGSVMAAPSISRRSRACLSGADLDGLQHLYPDCSRPHHGPPICIEARLHPYMCYMLQPHVTDCSLICPHHERPFASSSSLRCAASGSTVCSLMRPQVRRFTWAFRAAAVVGGPILVGSFVLLLAVYCARQSDKAHLKGVVGNLAEVNKVAVVVVVAVVILLDLATSCHHTSLIKVLLP